MEFGGRWFATYDPHVVDMVMDHHMHDFGGVLQDDFSLSYSSRGTYLVMVAFNK